MSKRKTKYYYIDDCVNNIYDDISIYEYKDEKDFFEGMLWNRDIAKEYGDKVESKKELCKLFKENENAAAYFNGATFVKTNHWRIADYGCILKTAKGVVKAFNEQRHRWVKIDYKGD